MAGEHHAAPSWAWYLASGVAAATTFYALPPDGAGRATVFLVVHLSVVVALVAGIRRHRPSWTAGWWVLVAGHALVAVANVARYVPETLLDTPVAFPSPTDALYLPAYLVIVSGLGWLMWRRSGRDRTALLDAGIVTVGVGGLSWSLLIRPYLDDPGLEAASRIFSLAVPLVDLVGVGAVVLVAFLPKARTPAYGLLAAGVVLNLVADTSLVLSGLADDPRGLFFGGWMAFYVLTGAAALHPSMRDLAEPAPQPDPTLSPSRLAFLAASALIPPMVIVVGEWTDPTFDSSVPGLVSAVLFVLALARVAGLAGDVSRHRQLEGRKDEFVSMVSHELRTPLTSIRGALGLLSSGALGEVSDKGRRMVEIASSNTDRLVRLINDILDVESLQSGRVGLELRDCDAADLVHQAIDALRPMADEAGVRLTVGARSTPLSADPDRILQTLINLIGNAVKFSPADRTVWVGAERRNGGVLFSVRDEGPGIPSDKLESIFGRFQQVDASDSRRKGGTGLGLAICRSIVTQHGGRIWAESRPGTGATFSFVLPAVAEPATAPAVRADTPDHPGPPQPAASPGGAAPAILVCDDDPAVLEVVSAMLTHAGYRVIPAADGRQALEAARAERPAAVLLDLIMPGGMSGWDTMAALREDPATAAIPVVAMTVLARGEAGSDPAAEWVRKPIDQPALFGALKAALSGATGATKVLIVEDDQGLAQVLHAMFERHGLVSYHAQGVRQAMEISRRVLPDLLVLDLLLPDGDGADLLDALRADERLGSPAVVVYTARDLGDAERERLQLGETEFFVKGRIGPEEFESRVVALLGRITADRAGGRGR